MVVWRELQNFRQASIKHRQIILFLVGLPSLVDDPFAGIFQHGASKCDCRPRVVGPSLQRLLPTRVDFCRIERGKRFPDVVISRGGPIGRDPHRKLRASREPANLLKRKAISCQVTIYTRRKVILIGSFPSEGISQHLQKAEELSLRTVINAECFQNVTGVHVVIHNEVPSQMPTHTLLHAALRRRQLVEGPNLFEEFHSGQRARERDAVESSNNTSAGQLRDKVLAMFVDFGQHLAKWIARHVGLHRSCEVQNLSRPEFLRATADVRELAPVSFLIRAVGKAKAAADSRDIVGLFSCNS